jgi:hypothetical protein
MRETQICEVCGARVVDLRRGRCFGCYTRWSDARPVGLGAACAVCNDRRTDNLRQVELLGAWVPLCGNCTVRTMRLQPMPRTLDAIRHALSRERRRSDRRQDAAARPSHAERRGLERRSVGHAQGGEMWLVDLEVSPHPTPAASA